MLQSIGEKLKGKISSTNAPVKASFWFLVCGFLQKAISMLTTPIYTRILSTQEYGTYSIWQSWFNIISIIATLNLAAGVYTRGLIKNEEDQDTFSSSLLGLAFTSITVWFFVYIVFHRTLDKLFTLPMVLMVTIFVDLYLHVAFQFWSNRERVNYRYKKLVSLTLGNILISQCLGILVVINSKVFKVELRLIFSVIVNIFLYTGLIIGIFKRGRTGYNKKYWRYALGFNLPLIPHYLSQIILNQSDRLMINALCGKTEAGIYAVAYSLAMVMQIFSSAISSTMNPWIYRNLKAKKYKSIGDISCYILIMVAFVNFVLIAFAPEALKILAPGAYQKAVWIIPPVTASVYFMFLYNLFATFEYYFEKTKYVMAASVVGAVLNIILNYIFIPIYGFLAAGYTTLACYILYAVAHYLFMRKVCSDYIGEEKIYDLKKIIAIGIALVGASAVMLCTYNYIWIRYSILSVACIIIIVKKKDFIQVFQKIKTKADRNENEDSDK